MLLVFRFGPGVSVLKAVWTKAGRKVLRPFESPQNPHISFNPNEGGAFRKRVKVL
jgi:hypothetical protein